jgi:hypothetical protein
MAEQYVTVPNNKIALLAEISYEKGYSIMLYINKTFGGG